MCFNSHSTMGALNNALSKQLRVSQSRESLNSTKVGKPVYISYLKLLHVENEEGRTTPGMWRRRLTVVLFLLQYLTWQSPSQLNWDHCKSQPWHLKLGKEAENRKQCFSFYHLYQRWFRCIPFTNVTKTV